mmetsp:Transcript_10865/g.17691  ORF Transcript_10865/g.17691 Transcript_10865/m.17691 type:complete len:461 (-) Transcript_10865:1590-2972(-)
MTSNIRPEQISACRKALSDDVAFKVAQNAVSNNNINDVTLNRSIVQEVERSAFSNQLDTWSVTNQKSSGRCWLFAALNLFRPATMLKLNLKEFEFSQAFIHFWDKFERSNHLLEAMIETAHRDFDDRTIHYLLGDPIGDGGQWNMATNLIRKHGLVPKSIYPESQSSSATAMMNATLKSILRTSACEIRAILNDPSEPNTATKLDSARVYKEKRMEDIWRILCIHLGTPPEEFEYQYKDKDSKYHRLPKMTPTAFVEQYVETKWEDYVCLVHDPRNEYMRTYTVEYLQNVVGGPPVKYLNIDVEQLKTITMQSLVDHKIPVWMGCDVGKMMYRQGGIWDLNIFEKQALYGVNFGMNKADRLRHRQTMMTHAMLFTGVDIDSTTNRPRRWRVENSWGDVNGVKGFYTMNDNWFNEHMFEISAPKSILPVEMQKVLDDTTTPPVMLPAWDPMGSLACQEAAL